MDGGERPRVALRANPYECDPIRLYLSLGDLYQDIQVYGMSPYRLEVLDFGLAHQEEIRQNHLRKKDLIEAENEMTVYLWPEEEP
jgi:hypothetical protein